MNYNTLIPLSKEMSYLASWDRLWGMPLLCHDGELPSCEGGIQVIHDEEPQIFGD